MDKCREAFEKNRFWIGIFKADVVFKSEIGEFGLYEALNSKVEAEYLVEFNNKWVIWYQCWKSRQAEVDQLNEAIERQGKLAIQAMNEAHKGSRLELSIAKDIQASLKPELIESERQMNAQLTDENMKLEARIDVACKSINSFFDNQVSTPTPREYANFIAEILETLRGEHEA